MSIFSKVFKSYSQKEVKRVMPIVANINELEESISKLSDEELKNKTSEFKAKLKEIYIVTCYSLIPMVIQAIGYDILSNVLTLNEQSFLNILNYACIILTAAYLIMGIINIQEFTLGKFIFTTVVTLLAMILIIFLIFLVGILVQQSGDFIKTVVMEVLYR